MKKSKKQQEEDRAVEEIMQHQIEELQRENRVMNLRVGLLEDRVLFLRDRLGGRLHK